MTQALREYILLWLKKAGDDLVTAQRLLEIEPMILDNACFHSQQAIEKCLKAYLIFNGYNVERTHNIIFLLSECAKYDPGFATLDPQDINSFAVQGRYPDTSIIPTIQDAKYYYQLGLQIEKLVKKKIQLE